MGYTTNFKGEILISPKPTEQVMNFINGLANSRRMKRDPSKLPEVDCEINPLKTHGEEGEFYFDPNSKNMGQERTKDVISYNDPPSTQPSLWLQWIIKEDKLQWDGGEKFYGYIKWLKYLIKKIFKPFGYTLNGYIDFSGEIISDIGRINVENNNVTVKLFD